MARRKPQGRQSGLDALHSLRRHLAKQPPAARPDHPPDKLAGTGATAPPDDFDLFRREMRDITPIDDGGRIELERPRPAPVPRPHLGEPKPEQSAHLPADTESSDHKNLFRESMADVTPLVANNRVDLSSEHALSQHRTYHAPTNPLAKPDPDLVRSHLPGGVSDAELFRHAISGALPLTNANRIESSPPSPRPEPKKRMEDESAALRESMEAPITLEDRLEMGDETAFLRPGLPRRVLIDLRRGRWTLQGEVDLHGFTREEARTVLATFLSVSLQRGARCVRVIHGKGLGSPGRVSILKQLARGWLAQREEILAFCQASPTQGGSGALMVLLRGKRPST